MKSVMRILINTNSFYPSYEGGPSNALFWLASGLAYAGYEVRVVTTNRLIPESTLTTDMWVALNGFFVIYESGCKKSVLVEEIKNSDVVITAGMCSLHLFYVNLFSLFYKKKIVISPRGEFMDKAVFHKGKYYGILKKNFFKFANKLYGKNVVYHVTSEEEQQVVKKLFPFCKTFLIPNYMILPPKVKEIKESIEPYFLYVGRISPIKSLDKLIRGLVLSEMFMKSSVKMYIVGDNNGKYYDSLLAEINKLGIQNKVVFLGIKTGEEKYRLYAEAKLTFLVSESENFGNVIIESLSQSTPVVASKGTPWAQLVQSGAGYWINNTPEEIAVTVDDFLKMSLADYEAMRDKAFLLSRKFDVYSNVDYWKRCLNNL